MVLFYDCKQEIKIKSTLIRFGFKEEIKMYNMLIYGLMTVT